MWINLNHMTSPYESEIRARITHALSAAQAGAAVSRVHLPARDAHASVHVPAGADVSALLAIDDGSRYGAPLVSSVRLLNGWLLFTFSPEFFTALVDEINRTLPLPDETSETYAENRMRVLARHEGADCPNIHVFHRALALALVAHESAAARHRAERAALTLFHTIPPRERPALLARCGALGGAMLRLLSASHE